MRTLRTIGAVGVAATLLLSANAVFAEERGTVGQDRMSEKAGERINEKPRMMVSSTTVREVKRDRSEVEREHGKVLQRLTDIKNKEKQQLAQRLAGQFEDINKTWTDHFNNQLDQYTAVLTKVQNRATVATSTGQNVSSTTAAIVAAQTAITSARAAVAVQAAKTYVVASSTIPTTATSTPTGQERIMQALRQSFKTLHSGLFKDLFALRDGPMKDARRAVQNAIRTLNKVSGVDDEHATSTKPSRNVTNP